ncbi:hypothetical protein H2200_007134 [Cladophialophora chaetospira]|uniref:Kelch repeat protein n=1 Tax=Cladophialophora chaetospira TaxID=386627 RepID=A0AA38X7Q5_9EURO|nr:hypothetical protein H2200_007134 [Cladophialophora chaetospira]
MRFVLTSLALLAWSISQAQSQRQRRDLDPDWVNQPTGFYRRGYLSSIVCGDYLYLDGGVVFTENETLPVKSTYSIPLAESWDPSEVQLKRIDKGDAAPVYNNPNLWLQTDNASFFSFNGDIAGEWLGTARTPKATPELWRFAPDGHGSGSWSLISTVPNLAQSVNAALATSNGVAYFLGGDQTEGTNPILLSESSSVVLSSNGLVSYNMSSQTWTNQSVAHILPNGLTWNAQLHHLVGIGNRALFLAMGGMTAIPGTSLSGLTQNPYNNVLIWNSMTNEWRNQSTTGDIPVGRDHACSVGLPGDNGTFEIFLYGGVHDVYLDTESELNIEMGQSVYVLSLPSFSWHKFSYPAQQVRSTQSCVIAARRQMIVVGGFPEGIDRSTYGADPWPQGLGIFDLTAMTWNSYYNSDARPYATPRRVKNYLAANGSYPQQWNDETVEQWIKGSTVTNTTAPPSGTSSAATSAPTHHSSSKTADIVGGVVGSVVGVLLLSALLWFLLRRNRRRRAQAERQEQVQYTKPELDDSSAALQAQNGSNKAKHVGTVSGPSELSGMPMHELEGSPSAYELSNDHRDGR